MRLVTPSVRMIREPMPAGVTGLRFGNASETHRDQSVPLESFFRVTQMTPPITIATATTPVQTAPARFPRAALQTVGNSPKTPPNSIRVPSSDPRGVAPLACGSDSALELEDAGGNGGSSSRCLQNVQNASPTHGNFSPQCG